MHQDRKRKLQSVYDECPERCEKESDGQKWNYDRDFCETCPQRIENVQFKEESELIFDERFREELTAATYHRILNIVYLIAGLEESDGYSAKTQILLRSFLSEKYKVERYLDSQKKPQNLS